jgi:hypothetical protein
MVGTRKVCDARLEEFGFPFLAGQYGFLCVVERSCFTWWQYDEVSFDTWTYLLQNLQQLLFHPVLFKVGPDVLDDIGDDRSVHLWLKRVSSVEERRVA